MVDTERLLEIAKEKEFCELCDDFGDDDTCMNCEKAKGITASELKEFWTHIKLMLEMQLSKEVVK